MGLRAGTIVSMVRLRMGDTLSSWRHHYQMMVSPCSTQIAVVSVAALWGHENLLSTSDAKYSLCRPTEAPPTRTVQHQPRLFFAWLSDNVQYRIGGDGSFAAARSVLARRLWRRAAAQDGISVRPLLGGDGVLLRHDGLALTPCRAPFAEREREREREKFAHARTV
jgi:hypothetical protein